ncbi:MAG: methyl-accepting chemotaxis sensory transducer [Clostridia bacterium]|jgi:methyl-accepting chemotaxis protein|nr:methyl-accepting chemotaxis sensory transducer [Clostridia bacterium]
MKRWLWYKCLINTGKSKSKLGGVKLSIRSKIILMVVTVIALLGVLNLTLLFNSFKYSSQYNKVIDNVIIANNINGVVKSIDLEMREIVNGKKNFKNGKQYEIISEIEKNTKRIIEQASTEDTKTKIDIIQRTMQTLKEHIEKIGKQIEQNSLVEERERTLEDIRGISGIIEENVQNFILFELENSKIVKQRIQQNFQRATVINTIVLCAALIISLIYVWIISRNISKPIRELCKNASLVAAGDLTIPKLEVRNCSEIQELADSFYAMLDSLKEIIGKVYAASSKVNNASTLLRENAQKNSSVGQEISAAIEEMVAGIQLQSNESKSTVKAAEMMYNISRDISGSSEKIINSANQSVKLAVDGNQCINAFISQLNNISTSIRNAADVAERLNASSKEMNRIVKTITAISEQTSLLALNASIEAARAGKAGKSFTVVAEEIRKLAQESAVSAQRISSFIKTVQTEADLMAEEMVKSIEQVSQGNKIGEQTRSYFNLIEEANKIVNRDVHMIIGELKRLIDSIESVNKSMTQIDKIINENEQVSKNIANVVQQQTTSLEQVALSALNLTDLANELEESVRKFDLETHKNNDTIETTNAYQEKAISKF